MVDFSNELFTPFWYRMNVWFEEQSVDTLGYKGYGKILWVSNGSVLRWLPPGEQSTTKDLFTTTIDLFAADKKTQ